MAGLLFSAEVYHLLKRGSISADDAIKLIGDPEYYDGSGIDDGDIVLSPSWGGDEVILRAPKVELFSRQVGGSFDRNLIDLVKGGHITVNRFRELIRDFSGESTPIYNQLLREGLLNGPELKRERPLRSITHSCSCHVGREGPCSVCVVLGCVHHENAEAFEREARLASSVIRVDRHDSHTGKWLGPGPEPENCQCIVCTWGYPGGI